MLEVRKLDKTMDGLQVLQRIDLNLDQGECAVILGPSGCGKSTLLHLIAGLTSPDGGQVLIGGEDCTGLSGRVGYLQQKDLLLPWLSLIDNASLPLILKGVKREEARGQAAALLPVFGLEGFDGYYPAQLSGGMRQRAALLRTFLCGNQIMLLDEPFASLDAITRRRLQEWLKSIMTTYHLSVLFVTHDIDEALLLGDRIYLLTSLPARVQRVFTVTTVDREREEIKKEVLSLLMQQDSVPA